MKAENVSFNEQLNAVIILDQTLLPNETRYLELRSFDELFEAIQSLRVRGAPAIGIFAAHALAVLAQSIVSPDFTGFLKQFSELADRMNEARPTAVNLSWACTRMKKVTAGLSGLPLHEICARLCEEAKNIQREDIAMCRKISEYGLSLLRDGDGILTHCNAGPLATSLYGTALGPLLLGHERGMQFHVFADETRPLLQGARLTTYELSHAGIDVTLICDNMASIVMKNGWINACLVGCDRVAANGDVANKIGTSGVAILAKHYNIPFYVLGPTSTIDLNCRCGDDIVIEQRNPDEVKTLFFTKPSALTQVPCFNPAFDVTDHSLISGIITEHGICRAPYDKSLSALF